MAINKFIDFYYASFNPSSTTTTQKSRNLEIKNVTVWVI